MRPGVPGKHALFEGISAPPSGIAHSHVSGRDIAQKGRNGPRRLGRVILARQNVCSDICHAGQMRNDPWKVLATAEVKRELLGHESEGIA